MPDPPKSLDLCLWRLCSANFKSSATAEDDVQEDDVEMTVEGGDSGAGDLTVQRYGKPQVLDQGGVDERKSNSLHL
jgi:hypothetical protein